MSTRARALPLAVGALVLAVALSSCGDAFHRPAAIVHGVSIGDDTVKATEPVSRLLTALLQQPCGTQAPGEPSRSPCLRYTVGFLIERQIVSAYAAAHDLHVAAGEVQQSIAALRQRFGPDQLESIIRQFGVDRSAFEGLVRERLLAGKVQQAVASAAVDESQLRAEYARERARFTLIHLAHIQVDTEQEANKIAAEVTPDNFAELAKKFSTDQGSSAQGGDLGTVPIGRFPPDFAKTALALQPGEISQPIETPGFGWHIIQLISVQVASYQSVRQQLQSQLYPPAIRAWFRGQVREGVEVNPRYGRLDPSTGDVVPLDTTATALPTPSPSGP